MPTLRKLISTRLRHWLMGPEFVAEIEATVRHLAAQRMPGAAPAMSASPAADAATQPLWVPAPTKGQGRLELLMPQLSGCGFYIELNPDPRRNLYQLYTPEGDRMAWGHDLAAMKVYGERLARERTEFDAPVPRNNLRG